MTARPIRRVSSVDVQWGELGERSRATIADRWQRVRGSLLLAVQAGVAAGLAWLVAHDLIGHRTPFFAPIAAVIVLGVSVGQRLRRAVELVVGVALGILVGDGIIAAIGTGPWQITVCVTLAMLVAVFLGGSAIVVGQASSSAVLVATLAPPTHGIYYSRFLDALVGGIVGVAVLMLLLPLNPFTHVRRAAAPVLGVLIEALYALADALGARDLERADAVLARLRGTDRQIAQFHTALSTGREVATLAPVRWRARAPLAQYLDAAVHVDRAVRNARVLARRVWAAIADQEPVPEELPVAIRTLGDCVDELRRQLGSGDRPEHARERAVEAVRQAATAYREGVEFSGMVAVGQVRAIATDLLRAAGLEDRAAGRLVRHTFNADRTGSPLGWRHDAAER
ncbi:MAG TPA: FUSC family protein [Micromonosporaceae bacterium]